LAAIRQMLQADFCSVCSLVVDLDNASAFWWHRPGLYSIVKLNSANRSNHRATYLSLWILERIQPP
jgi:hypothetical protein